MLGRGRWAFIAITICHLSGVRFFFFAAGIGAWAVSPYCYNYLCVAPLNCCCVVGGGGVGVGGVARYPNPALHVGIIIITDKTSLRLIRRLLGGGRISLTRWTSWMNSCLAGLAGLTAD